VAIVEWSDDFNTGVPDIDMEHRQLFALINDFHDKFLNGSADTAIKAAIDALVGYVDYHFTREEALLDACRYQGTEDHKRQHRELREQIEWYRKSYIEAPAEFDFKDFVNFLVYWVESHITVTDMGYVPSVQSFVGLVSDPST